MFLFCVFSSKEFVVGQFREFVKMNSNFFKNVETNVHKDPYNLDFSYDIVNTLCW